MMQQDAEAISENAGQRMWRFFVHDDRGDDLVEFALAATVFFMTVFGILEFGQAVFRYNMLSDLAQEGARRATVCGTKATLGSGDCDIRTYVSGRSVGLLAVGDVSCGSSDTTCTGIASKNIGDTVTVQVQKSFTPLTALIPHSAIPMSATSKMIVVR